MMLQILSELLTPNHPHQYLYGPTEIGREDVVLDIGACEGSFSARVTSRCNRVIAVEPSRTMCHLMEELFTMRRQPCPVIVNCLLGSEPGTAYFADNAVNPGSSRITAECVEGAYEVPVVTLDQLVQTLAVKPTFVKCDAEGAALAIFTGGRAFLERSRPKIACASYHTDSEFPEMYALLKSLGYEAMGKGFAFDHDRFRVCMIHAW
jgi:FkbM family methyltransferase